MYLFLYCFLYLDAYTLFVMNYIQYTQWDQNIFLVNMTREISRPFSDLMTKWITKFIQQWKKILIINNKKWWSTWRMCHDCGHVPHCTQCDIPIAWHKDPTHQDLFWICHICKTHYPESQTCDTCDSQEISLYGMWNQQLLEEVRSLWKIEPLLVDAWLANSKNKISKLHQSLDTQVLIWTSLLSTPPHWRTPDMVCLVQADTWLHSPHFAARYNNFLFLHDCISHYSQADILMQSYDVDEQSIIAACTWDIQTLLSAERYRRQERNYPPYVQMCVIMYKHEIEASLYTKVHKLYQELLYLREKFDLSDIEIYETPPTIYKMFGKYRYHIILKGPWLREFMDIAYSKLKIPQRWCKIDWAPTTL